MNTIEYEGRTVYTEEDPRCNICKKMENESYIVWSDMAFLDTSWDGNQYCNGVMAYDKNKDTVRGVFSITDKRCGVHYAVYLDEIVGDILKITVAPDSSTLEPEKKEIDLKKRFK